jgi:ankyrin repeat protein
MAGAALLAVMLTCLFASSTIWVRSQYGPLQRAAADGDVRELEQLLRDGAYVNTRCDFRSWTALHVAADRGQVAAARVLLEHGAKVDLQDTDGYTPLHVTGSNPKAHPRSTESARNEVAVVLLDHGANPNATTNYGYNPLHCAVRSDDAALVRILLDRGADPSHTDSGGYTPLELARHLDADGTVLQALRPAAPTTNAGH